MISSLLINITVCVCVSITSWSKTSCHLSNLSELPNLQLRLDYDAFSDDFLTTNCTYKTIHTVPSYTIASQVEKLTLCSKLVCHICTPYCIRIVQEIIRILYGVHGFVVSVCAWVLVGLVDRLARPDL